MPLIKIYWTQQKNWWKFLWSWCWWNSFQLFHPLHFSQKSSNQTKLITRILNKIPAQTTNNFLYLFFSGFIQDILTLMTKSQTKLWIWEHIHNFRKDLFSFQSFIETSRWRCFEECQKPVRGSQRGCRRRCQAKARGNLPRRWKSSHPACSH